MTNDHDDLDVVGPAKPLTTKPTRSLAQLKRRFATDEVCKEYLVQLRWPTGRVVCPRCGKSDRVYALKTRPFHWVCKNPTLECPGIYRFSVLTGTVFENTKIPLRTWFEVIYLMTQSKKGISALQVHRLIDPVSGSKGSYRTAWYMCHRIRAAMRDGTFRSLTGVVEMDETYVGGKARNRHAKRQRSMHYGGVADKVAVIGAIARKGNVVCRVIERVDGAALTKFVNEAVSNRVSLVATDEANLYKSLPGFMPHETVNHSKGEHVRGNVHTANLDSFWSLLKRGIVGTFHKVSKEHLPLYLNEFSFRYNNRKNPDIFEAVLAGC